MTAVRKSPTAIHGWGARAVLPLLVVTAALLAPNAANAAWVRGGSVQSGGSSSTTSSSSSSSSSSGRSTDYYHNDREEDEVEHRWGGEEDDDYLEDVPANLRLHEHPDDTQSEEDEFDQQHNFDFHSVYEDYDYDYRGPDDPFHSDDGPSRATSQHHIERFLGMNHDNMFQPLDCNNVTEWDCTSTPLSSLMGDADTSEILIPCGTCAYWDLPPTEGSSSTDFDMPHGLNVEGKLHIPSTTNGTIRTTHVFIQGILQIDPPMAGHLVKFLLHGSEEKYLHPHMGNMHACDMEVGCKVGKKPIVVAGGLLQVHGIADPHKCPSWVKLNDISEDLTTVTLGHTVSAGCYHVGDEILFTSPDSHFSFQKSRFVESIDVANGALVLTEALPDYYSEATEQINATFAVEVARLSRGIVFDAEDDDPTNDGGIGGHFVVLHTPHVAQELTGVEVRNFGQQGNLGRYPIHFHMCDSASGSIVSKNVIRKSNQRCIVIHGTDDVHIYDNVAYEAFGHCFFTEDGIEEGNVFERNLGAGIRAPKFVIAGENDDIPAVFWITNPHNKWIGNVAAGCSFAGFWFDTRDNVRGPSDTEANKHIKPRYMDMELGSFRDNTAHSIFMRGVAMYNDGWRPPHEVVFENTNLYRNRGDGWFVHGNINMAIVGGILADNGHSIANFRASNNRFENITFIGFSPEYHRVIQKTGSWWYCPHGTMGMLGMTLHTYNPFPDEAPMGTVGKNLEFYHYADGSCGDNSVPIVFSNAEVQAYADTPNRLSGLTFHDGQGTKRISACLLQDEFDTRTIVVEDADGSLSVTGERGFAVSNTPDVTTFINGDGCETTGGDELGCLVFCPNACVRQVTFMTNNAFSTRDVVMEVTRDDGTGGTTTVDSPWTHNAHIDRADFHTHALTDGRYGLALPAGSYTVSFRDNVTGEVAWPDYVEEEYELPPTSCTGYLEPNSITIVRPPPIDGGRCTDLVKGGTLDEGTHEEFEFHEAWQAFSATVTLVSPGAGGSGHALYVSRVGGFVSQWIDVSCLVAGQMYEFTADLKLEHAPGVGADCVPSTGLFCPVFNLGTHTYDKATEEKAETWRTLATVDPAGKDADGWYKMRGSVIVTEDDVNASRMKIKIDQGSTLNYILDNISMKKSSTPTVDTITYVDTVLSSDDIIVPIGGTATLDGKKEDRAIDGTMTKVYMSMMEGSDPGFEIIPMQASCTVVNGIKIFSANNYPDRDPTSYVIEGRSMLGSGEWETIASGGIAVPNERNAETAPPDDTSHHKLISFDNQVSYAEYRVTFPTVKSPSLYQFQIGEIQLPGFLCPEDYESPPGTGMTENPGGVPSDSTPQGTNIALGQTTSQSSDFAEGVSSRAVDGDTNGNWIGNSVTHTINNYPWWRVDFERDYEVNDVVLWVRTDCCREDFKYFMVELLDAQGNQVETYMHPDMVPQDKPNFHIAFNTPVVARTVKVHMYNTAFLMLAEVEVFGQLPDGTPTDPPTRSPTTRSPTVSPTVSPTRGPTVSPTTSAPTMAPTTKSPTKAPTITSSSPTKAPVAAPITCGDDLIYANGDAEESPLATAPFTKSHSNGPVPMVMTEDLDNGGIGNQYFYVAGRQFWWDGLMINNLSPDCLDESRAYAFRFDYRIHSTSEYAARVRVDYKRSSDGIWEDGALDSICPQTSSTSTGWVTCEINEQIPIDPATATEIRIGFWTDGAESATSDVDFDNISITEYVAPAPTTPSPPTPSTPMTTSAPTQAPVGTASSPSDNMGVFVDNVLSNTDMVEGVGGVEHFMFLEDQIINDQTDKFFLSMEVGKSPGFEIIPSASCTIVTSLKVFTSDDAEQRDPTSFIVEGRRTLTDEYEIVKQGALPLPSGRNPSGAAVDDALYHKLVTFPNDVAYEQYRVTFPTIKGPELMQFQIGEAQLPGYLCPDDYVSPSTPAPVPTPTVDTSGDYNLALGKPTSQSSNFSDGVSSRAVDGNKEGLWWGNSVTHTNDLYPYWTVDLGGEYTINEVVLWNRMDCCQDYLKYFTIEFLDADGNTVDGQIYQDYPATVEQQDLHFPVNGVVAESVVIHLYSSAFLMLAEVEVFGH